MGLTREARETRDHVIALLVDEEYARRIAAGTIDKGKLRELIEKDVVAQARREPTWLRQQGDRLLGAQPRPAGQHQCPHCEITFSPHDQEATRGSDGLLYCRPSCADGEPLVSLDEYLAEHPEAAAAGHFLRTYLQATKGEDRVPQLDLLTIGDTE